MFKLIFLSRCSIGPKAQLLRKHASPPRALLPSLADAMDPHVRLRLPTCHPRVASSGPWFATAACSFFNRVTHQQLQCAPPIAIVANHPSFITFFPCGRESQCELPFSFSHLAHFSWHLKPLVASSSPQLAPHSISCKL